MTYKALIVGDVVGRCGRNAIERALPELQWELGVDFTVVNGENTCGGRGLNRQSMQFYRDMGVDAVTLGNHLFGNRDILTLLKREDRLVRPANLPANTLGKLYQIIPCGEVQIAVINLLGRVYMGMPALDCPFKCADALIKEIREQTPIIFVDFHAEATSEKLALARFLDGRVTAVWGTHTHIQTSDARLLPRGTAYITDLGMTGAVDSVLGMEANGVIDRYLTGCPTPFTVAEGEAELCGALLEFADDGRAVKIEAVRRRVSAF